MATETKPSVKPIAPCIRIHGRIMSAGKAELQKRKDKPGSFVRTTQSLFCGGESVLVEMNRIFDENAPEVKVVAGVVESSPLFKIDQVVELEITPDALSMYNDKLRIGRWTVVNQ